MLAALIGLTIAQEIPDLRYLPIKQSELQFPIFAGAQEIAVGAKRQSPRTLGFFVNSLEAGHFGDKVPTNYVDARVGHTTWSVTPGVFGSSPCLAISCTAFRNQSWEYRKTVYGLKHKGSRTWYVDEGGKLLGETCDLEMATGRWSLDVTYGKEDYTVTSTVPGKPRRTLTVTPGCGIEALTIDPFRPMIKADPTGKAAEVLLKEKTYYALDPMTASPLKYTARVSGAFSGKIFDRDYTGLEVELVGGPERQYAWIAHDGNMLKMVLSTAGAYLLLDMKPD